MSPYLSFAGTCREAFAHYAEILGGVVEMTMTPGESPMRAETPAEQHDDVMHSRIRIGDNVLMGADAPPQWRTKPQGFAVAIEFDSVAEAERVFADLALGGTTQMPMAETFWAERFGMCIDRWGTPWMVSGPGKM